MKESVVFKAMYALKRHSLNDLVKWLYQPTDPSSLGVIRFLFGKNQNRWRCLRRLIAF